MRFTEIRLRGAFLIEPEPIEDERGFFARIWCQEEFRKHGLTAEIAQISLSFTKRRGILRGMHYQVAPHEEVKLVRCTRGAIYDVLLDLRPGSATFGEWFSVRLSAENRQMIYVPKGFAHGFLSLVDATEVLYQISEFHHPESARGVRWNDPAFGIEWPDENPVVSAKDQAYEDFPR
jgi:dTDP-4-dehydrorhamnose 3,5-epimerase